MPMRKTGHLHQGKLSFRRHYLEEWMAERNIGPMDLLDSLNEAANMDTPPIDKSQVYRWLKGQLPRRPTQIRIAAALNLLDVVTGEPDPELLTTHPAMALAKRRVDFSKPDEAERFKQLVEAAFPERTGTRN